MTRKKRPVFLLGSGFSHDLAGLPLLSDLSDGVNDYIRSIAASGDKRFDAVWSCIQNTPKNVQSNIEYLLTLFRGSQPWLAKADSEVRSGSFHHLSNAVAEKIKEHEAENNLNPDAEDAFLKLVDYWKSSEAKVISFNYDTLVEKIAGEHLSKKGNHVGAAEFYVGPFTNLLNRTESTWAREPGVCFDLIKLHGSVNWYYSGNEDFSGEPIFIDPLFDDSHQFLGDVEDNKVDLVELIIPPLLDKDPYMNHSLLRYQWKMALTYIAQATDVYVIGYSLPQTDLSAKFMLMESDFHSKATWHVLLHESDADEVERRFKSVLTGNVKYLRIPDKSSSIAFLMGEVNK